MSCSITKEHDCISRFCLFLCCDQGCVPLTLMRLDRGPGVSTGIVPRHFALGKDGMAKRALERTESIIYGCF